MFVVVLSSELLPLPTATPSWLLIEELLLHSLVRSGLMSLGSPPH